MIEIITKNAEETRELGKKIGASLKSGDVVALTGELGSGKTTLIQGLAAGIGVSDFVTSPTFILIGEYSGIHPFIHVDLYRLEEEKEIEDLGILEYFDGRGIVAIEWAERMRDLLPENLIKIEIESLDETKRRIRIAEIGIKRIGKI
ncbi:MAG: tRNA (adenosine(37)-N6)-threonylcarbamoyltransferase complex ATPase subunit type 1 TsaE [Candidatus Saganbacteria bacterium]|nr:tRNA (adenosine(37)-N6)-threonylcarbamoyltransferase complex ATPase subunit type 1 TsaE [Candidatus Saganbacteria bacterium]